MTTSTTIPSLPAAIHRKGRLLVLAMLVLLPLCYIPQDIVYNYLDTPRRLLMLLGAGLLAALTLAAWAARRQAVLRWCPTLDRPVLYFLLAATFSAITAFFGSMIYVSFGPVWSQDSIWLVLAGVLLYCGVKEFLREPADREAAIVAMVLTGGVMAIIGMLDFFRPMGLSEAFSGHRLVAMLGNPMFTGTYFAMLIPLGGCVGFTLRGRMRILVLGCTLLMLPALAFTMARAAWVGLALTVLLLLGVVLSRAYTLGKGVLMPIAIGVLALIIGVGVLVGVHPGVRARVAHVIDMRDNTAQSRMVFMQGALNAFLGFDQDEFNVTKQVNRPTVLLGWGIGNMRYVYPQFRPNTKVTEMGVPMNRGYSSALPHNTPLQVAAEMGILGLATYLILVFALFRAGMLRLRDAQNPPLLVLGVLGFVFANIFSNLLTFDNAATMGYFWMGAGLLAAMGASDVRVGVPKGRVVRDFSPARLVMTSVLAWFVVGIFVVAVGTQSAAAFLVQRAVNRASGAYDIFTSLQNRGLQAAAASSEIGTVRSALVAAEHDARMAQRLTVIPEATVIQALFTVHQMQSMVASTPESAIALANEELVPNLMQGFRAFPREPVLLRSAIMTNMQYGNYQKAIQLATYLSSLEPHSAEVRLMLADAYEALKQYEEAVYETENAIRLDPLYGQAWANLAQIYFVRAKSEAGGNVKKNANSSYVNFKKADDLDFDFATYPPMINAYALVAYFANDMPTAKVMASRIAAPQLREEFVADLNVLQQVTQRDAEATELRETAQAMWTMQEGATAQSVPSESMQLLLPTLQRLRQ